jgi:hypothetical protein
MPMYSMALAAAADNSLRHEFVEVGTSVLLLNALGAVLAPLGLGQLMALGDPSWSVLGLRGAVQPAGQLCFATQFRRKRAGRRRRRRSPPRHRHGTDELRPRPARTGECRWTIWQRGSVTEPGRSRLCESMRGWISTGQDSTERKQRDRTALN